MEAASIGFGAVYNYDSNELNSYSTYYKNFTPTTSVRPSDHHPFFDFSCAPKRR